MRTFFIVLSEQNIAEKNFGREDSVLTEHLDPMFPEWNVKPLHVATQDFAKQWSEKSETIS